MRAHDILPIHRLAAALIAALLVVAWWRFRERDIG